MAKKRTLTTVAGAAVLVLFGSVAATQQQVPPPRLDVDSLGTALGLSPEARAELAPRIEELNSLLARHDQHRREAAALMTELQEVRTDIASSLTPEQQRAFHGAPMGTWSRGGGMGSMGPGPMGMGGRGMGAMGRGPMGMGARGMGAGPMGMGAAGVHPMDGTHRSMAPMGSMGGGHMHRGHGMRAPAVRDTAGGGSTPGPTGMMGGGNPGGL